MEANEQLDTLELVPEIDLEWENEYGWVAARGICLADLHHMAGKDDEAYNLLSESILKVSGAVVIDRVCQIADHYARVLLLGRGDMVGTRYAIESDSEDAEIKEIQETVAAYLSALVKKDTSGRAQLVITSEPRVVVGMVHTLFRLANDNARVIWSA